MIKLILLMWLSDFVGSLDVLGALSLITFCACFVIACIAYAVAIWDSDKPSFPRVWKFSWWLLIPASISLIVPSQTTVRLLAAGQVMQMAAGTQMGQKSIAAVDAILDKITKGASK